MIEAGTRVRIVQHTTARVRELAGTPYALRAVSEIELSVTRLVEALSDALGGQWDGLKMVARQIAVLRASQGFRFSEVMRAYNVFRDTTKQYVSPKQMAGIDDALVSMLVVLSQAFEEAQTKAGYMKILDALSTALDAKEHYTSSHCGSVQSIAERLAGWLGVEIDQAGRFHDIGKIYVPDQILMKPGPLEPEERVVMRQHPYYSFKILSPVSDQLASITLRHHERPDGKGYPLGENATCLEANVVAAADTLHAVVSHRCYQQGRSQEEALQVIRAARGTQFLPATVEAVEKLFPQMLEEVTPV